MRFAVLRTTVLGLSVLLALAASSARAASWGEVVRGMGARAPDEQRHFAALALAELIDRHEHELNRAARSKAGWQRGMRSYVARLQDMARAVEAGEPVRLVREAAGEVRMIVGRAQVMLATPNLGGQHAYERAVVDAWCADVDCSGAAPNLARAAEAPTNVPRPPDEPAPPLAIDASQAPVPPPTTVPPATTDAPADPLPARAAVTTAGAGAAPTPARSDAMPMPAAPAAAPVPPPAPGTRRVATAPTAAAAVSPAEVDGVKRFAAADTPLPARATPLPPVMVPTRPEAQPAPAPASAVDVAAGTSTADQPARPVVHLSPATEAGTPGPVRGGWSFGDRAPPLYAAEDGLQCAFADLRHVKLKQAACAAVLRELRDVLALLRDEHVAGRRVDWDQLKLRPAGVDAPALLQLTAAARPVPIRAPYLAAAPAVLAGARPWLQARLAGQRVTYRIEAPESLGYLAPPTLVSAP